MFTEQIDVLKTFVKIMFILATVQQGYHDLTIELCILHKYIYISLFFQQRRPRNNDNPIAMSTPSHEILYYTTIFREIEAGLLEKWLILGLENTQNESGVSYKQCQNGILFPSSQFGNLLFTFQGIYNW